MATHTPARPGADPNPSQPLRTKAPSHRYASPTVPDLEQVTGRYFAARKPEPSSASSYARPVAARLWHISTSLTGRTSAG